jgi:hypothetical protein
MRSAQVLIIVLVFITTSAINSLGKPLTPGNDLKKLSQQSQVLLNLAKDFMEMARAQRGNNVEFEIASELNVLASTAHDYLNAAGDLLWVYAQITNPADRTAVKSYINERLNDYASLFDELIKNVNLNLSYSASSGIAATGMRLRDELREGQSLLKSVIIK